MSRISRPLIEMEGKTVMRVIELDDEETDDVSLLFYCADDPEQPVADWSVHYLRMTRTAIQYDMGQVEE